MNPIKVDDVFEVPAHEDVDALDGRRCNVPSILQVSGSDHSSSKVPLRELRGFHAEPHLFYLVFRHLSKNFADGRRRTFELGEGKVRKNKCVQPLAESIEKLSGERAEFLVETASDDRGIRIDSASQSRYPSLELVPCSPFPSGRLRAAASVSHTLAAQEARLS